MGIEQDIKMTKFESERHKAYLNLLYTANWMGDLSKQVMKPFGVTPQQYNVLRILRGKHPKSCTAGDIKAVMIDKGPDLTRLIDRLVSKGWVKRDVCEHNRRQLDIEITKAGLDLIKSMQQPLRDNLQWMNEITEKEAKELSRILDKLRG